MARARPQAADFALIHGSCTMTESRFIAVAGSERTPAFGAMATRASDAEAWIEATRTVQLGGPVSAMEQAFQVRLLQYDGIRGPYRGRVGALHVPAALEKDIV